MSLLDPTSCLYAKDIAAEYFSHNNGLKKSPAESFPHFKGRVINLPMTSWHLFFQIIKYCLKHLQIFPAVIKSFQQVGKKKSRHEREILTLFSKTQWQVLHQ